MTLAKKLEKPEWASAIAAFRERHGFKQSDLAQRLSVTQAAISKWESGEREPTLDIYLKLARIAQGVERRQFLQRAGITQDDLDDWAASRVPPSRPVVATIEVIPAHGSTTEHGGGRLKRKPDAVLIPLLHDAAAAGSPRLIQESEIDDYVIARSRRTPHPEHTVAIRVTGDSMSPTLEDGYIVILDTKQTQHEQLFNEMVAARDPEGGVTVKWLRNVEGEPMLVAQHTSPRYSPVFLARKPGWKIVGRVLWWIGEPK